MISFHIWHFYKGVWIWQERFLHLISQIDINLFSMMFPFKWLQIMLIALPFATVCLWLNCTLFVQMKPYHCHLHLIQLFISSKKCMLIIKANYFWSSQECWLKVYHQRKILHVETWNFMANIYNLNKKCI